MRTSDRNALVLEYCIESDLDFLFGSVVSPEDGFRLLDILP